MARNPVALFSAFLIVPNLACAGRLDGTWVATKAPAEKNAPGIAEITFDQSGRFTAASIENSQRRILVGTFRWKSGKLTLLPDGRPPMTIPARIAPNGELQLSASEGEGQSTMMTRVNE